MSRSATAIERTDPRGPGGSHPLGDSLSIPAFFLLLFLAILLVSVGVYLLYGWSRTEGVSPGWFAALLPIAVLRCLPGVMVTAIFCIFFRLHRRPGIKGFTLLLLGVTAAVVLYGVWTGMYALASSERDAPENPTVAMSPGYIHVYADGIVYVESVDDTELHGVVMRGIEPSATFSAFTSGRFIRESMRIRAAGSVVAAPSADGGGGTPNLGPKSETSTEVTPRDGMEARPENPFFDPLLTPPGPFEALTRDAEVLYSGILESYLHTRTIFWFSILSLVVYSIGSLCLFEMTRWPLFNLMISFLTFRCMFWLYGLAGSDYGIELAEVLGGAAMGALLAPGLLLLCGVVFICLDIVLISHRTGGRV